VRLTGKPGITGLWQVSGRSDLPFEKMVDLDRYYLEHWSLGLDFSILLRTVRVVLRHDGAY
jgi:lipopolysaccharide/colanic/teichoic acid biosynthesis glycosyltransferase